jgi:TolB-like protein
MKKPLAILLLLFSFASAQQTIAVIEFEGKGVSQPEASALSDELEIHLSNIGGYIVIERSERGNILEEQGFQQTGCVSSECAVEVGKLLGSQLIVVGSISKVGSTFAVTAKIVDVQTGKITRTANYKYRGIIDDLLISGMAEVASQLTGQGGPKVSVQAVRPSVPVKRMGSIHIIADPEDAVVFVDQVWASFDEGYKKTPLTVDSLDIGDHKVEVVKLGYLKETRIVEVKENETSKLNIVLKKSNTRLAVKSDPTGASIQINEKDEGVTPKVFTDLEPAQYRLGISLPSYDNFFEVITLEAGDSIEVDTKLIRYLGSIDITTSVPTRFVLEGESVNSIEGDAPTILENIPTGGWHLVLKAEGYIPVETSVQIRLNEIAAVKYEMTSIEELERKISLLESRKKLWLMSSGALFLSTGLISYLSDQTYDDYLTATSNANTLRDRFELLDEIMPFPAGIGGLVALVLMRDQYEVQQLKNILEKGIITDLKE